jgi:hypothetical protein
MNKRLQRIWDVTYSAAYAAEYVRRPWDDPITIGEAARAIAHCAVRQAKRTPLPQFAEKGRGHGAP